MALALIARIVVFKLVQCNTALKNLGPWVPGVRVLRSLGPRSSGPGSSVYSTGIPDIATRLWNQSDHGPA